MFSWEEVMNRSFYKMVIVLMLGILFLTGCKLPAKPTIPQKMGTFMIINNHVRGSDPFPGGKFLPDTRQHGICIIVYPLIYPSGLVKPPYNMILANDEQTTTTTVGAGIYLLQEWQFDSEINQDPFYIPEVKTQVRPMEIVNLKAGETITFGSERNLPQPGDFKEGAINPLCRAGSQSPGGDHPTITPTISVTVTETPSSPAITTPLPQYITSHLILDETLDFPLCWVGYISTGMRPCADTTAALQNIDTVWPTTAKTFEFEFKENTWWGIEVNRGIDDIYPGSLGVDIQFLDANGNWAGPLSYYAYYPTTGTTTRNGVLEGQPVDPAWMNKIGYTSDWKPLGPGKYRILVYSEVKYFDGAVYGYWPSRGTIKVYSFDNVP
jgi:hypothetical protein